MRNKLTRREFLKLSGAAAIGFGFRDLPPGSGQATSRQPTFSLGRTVYSLRYYERPSFSSREMGYYFTDTVVKILEEREGDPRPTNNPLWLRTENGWLHSAYVQPVEEHLNEPVWDIPAGGMLVEVTVPLSQAYKVKENVWKRAAKFYYKSTHWVYYTFAGINNTTWYQVLDDRNGGFSMVEAEHMRPVQAEELTPINPGVADKRIDVDLNRQRVIAYEGNRPVFTARTATGYFEGDTPIGEFRVERKQPSRHMASNAEGNEFDLPGVPWVCYISWTGVSLHGTYWHYNYGTPQSHGCINLLPSAALWLYRWSDPFVPLGEDYVESDEGTRVVVF